jgi:hypothetical protein
MYSRLHSIGLPGNAVADGWRLADLPREYRGDAHTAGWTLAGTKQGDDMKETRVEGRSAARGPVSRRTASAVDGGEVDHTVIIIGAGFGGIGVAISLKKAGIENFVVLDKDAGPGGTWRDNVYPGVACDVPAILYEYPFEPNPDWSQMFAPGADIQSYA